MGLIFRRAVFDHDILALGEPRRCQALAEGGDHGRGDRKRRAAQEADGWYGRLLRPRRERPRGGRAAEQRDELAALHPCAHSITSSARTRIVSGMVMPRTFAILRFTT